MYQVHSQASAPEASRATMEAMEKKYGFVPNLIGVLAESPAAVQAYAAIAAALEHSALSAVEQQVVTLTVSAANTTVPTAWGPTPRSRQWSACRKMCSPRYGINDPCPTRSSRRSAHWSCPSSVIAAGSRRMSWSRPRRPAIPSGHVLDVLTIVALKTLSNYVNHIAHTPLDPQFAPQAWTAPTAPVG
jgi:hypothetical protein